VGGPGREEQAGEGDENFRQGSHDVGRQVLSRAVPSEARLQICEIVEKACVAP
jgi:hypothetical protein